MPTIYDLFQLNKDVQQKKQNTIKKKKALVFVQ